MMPLQRACGAESQARNKLSNGPLRAQGNVVFTEYSATLQADVILPGICWYPAKRTGHTVNQGGTADNRLFVLDRSYCSVRDIFLLLWQKTRGAFYLEVSTMEIRPTLDQAREIAATGQEGCGPAESCHKKSFFFWPSATFQNDGTGKVPLFGRSPLQRAGPSIYGPQFYPESILTLYGKPSSEIL